MFLKYLKISNDFHVIRKIVFHKGINLIVDSSEGHITGNSVGKTTVLKLIDFCLGADPKNIYQDPESKKEIYKLVKEFLVENKVLITLCLTENLDNDDAKNIIIKRNFLARNKIIRIINDKSYIEDEFEPELTKLFFPDEPTGLVVIFSNVSLVDPVTKSPSVFVSVF